MERSTLGCYPHGELPSQAGTADTVTMVTDGQQLPDASLATATFNNVTNGLSPLQQIWYQQLADANRRQVRLLLYNTNYTMQKMKLPCWDCFRGYLNHLLLLVIVFSLRIITLQYTINTLI